MPSLNLMLLPSPVWTSLNFVALFLITDIGYAESLIRPYRRLLDKLI